MAEKKEKSGSGCCCGSSGKTGGCAPKKAPASNELEEKIKTFLDKEIKPALANDGGSCEFVAFKNGIVQLRLQGACRGCPGARFTLKMGIETRMKEAIPEVSEVEAVE